MKYSKELCVPCASSDKSYVVTISEMIRLIPLWTHKIHSSHITAFRIKKGLLSLLVAENKTQNPVENKCYIKFCNAL